MSTSSSQPPAPLELPEQFGPYRILRPLGKGGMGTVYLALDTRLNRQIALKVCHIATHPTAQERFRREAQAAAGLRHANLCPVYEFDVRDGIAYLTMAYFEGQTLDRRLAEQPMAQRDAALLVRKLALAMQAAHDKGVVHRDLKPGNIAFDEKGEPVVLDFGLARQTEAAGTRLTKLGAILGTPSYMAPEQVEGNLDQIGPACDVYALGVILYELLTGTVPFAGPLSAVLGQVLAVAPQPPRQRNAAVDEQLEAICLKALAKKPGDRFPSMTALAADVTRYLRSTSTTNKIAAKQTPPPRAAVAVPTQFAHLTQLSPPPMEPAPAQRRKKAGDGRHNLWLIVWVMLAVVAGVVGLARWRQRTPGVVDTAGPAKLDDRRQKQIEEEEDQRRLVIQNEAEKNRLADEEARRNKLQPLGMKFVRLPKGTFYMGWDGAKRGTKTEIKEDFEIAIHTVTQDQWQAVMGRNPSYFSRDGGGKVTVKDISDADLKQFPVEQVSWNDVQAFIKKLNERERGNGRTYRLPTEAEWEYACRGGATTEEECSYHFYFAKSTNDLSSEQANFNGNFPDGNAPKGKCLGHPMKVGSYPPNKLGLYDMHGNVWQWCSDLYAPKALVRVMRGGSWFGVGVGYCRSSTRLWDEPNRRSELNGFRLVAVPDVGAK